jgi:hypothetical protein
MRSGSVEIVNILLDHPVQVALVKNEHVIEAFASHTPKKTFTDSIGFGSTTRDAQDVDTAGSTTTDEAPNTGFLPRMR